MIGPLKLNSFKEASKRELLFWYNRDGQKIHLRYQVDPTNITWPLPTESERAYELWKTTCFELFLKEEGSNEYIELNFSPSGQWDCYHFKSYRSPQPPTRYDHCRINFIKQELGLIEVEVLLPEIPDKILANATAVIEDDSGVHYFAFKHAKNKADFHDHSTLLIKLY